MNRDFIFVFKLLVVSFELCMLSSAFKFIYQCDAFIAYNYQIGLFICGYNVRGDLGFQSYPVSYLYGPSLGRQLQFGEEIFS